MTEQHQDAPKFIFFRKTPKDLMSRPPLASSLQTLETSFLLIALRRYPHALISCASAIESALRAGLNCSQDERHSFGKLLEQAQQQLSPKKRLDRSHMDDFREKRNEIIHYGFSPKDDAASAILLLETGFPLVEQYYIHYFDFHLKRHGGKLGGLVPDVDRHLDIAQKVYSKAKELDGLNLTYCFLSFAHDVGWGSNHWMLSDWQMNALGNEEESGWFSWEFKEKQKVELEGKLGTSWTFDCPICDEAGTFVVELDNHALEQGNIRLTRGACVNCSFVIPANCPFLRTNSVWIKSAKQRPRFSRSTA